MTIEESSLNCQKQEKQKAEEEEIWPGGVSLASRSVPHWVQLSFSGDGAIWFTDANRSRRPRHFGVTCSAQLDRSRPRE